MVGVPSHLPIASLGGSDCENGFKCDREVSSDAAVAASSGNEAAVDVAVDYPFACTAALVCGFSLPLVGGTCVA